MLDKIIKKPHIFFFGLIPLFIIISILKGKNPIDINVHDIYFVSDVKFWCYLSSVFFGLIGLNYFSINWVKKNPKKWLTIIHIILQIIVLVPFIYLLLVENLNSTPFASHQFMMTYLFIAFIVFLFSIFIHLINFFTSLFLKTE